MAERIDTLLCKTGLLASRAKAKAAIEMGLVTVNGRLVKKPSEVFEETDLVSLSHPPYRYVSRAGDKLDKALETFAISAENAVCLDIGASTGGFTDCLIQHGAAKVFAVDVGKAQLDESLQGSEKIVSLEETDIRTLQKEMILPPDIITADVSFISLTLVLPHIRRLMKEDAKVICLIKPQFEAGRKALNKNGVVANEKDRLKAIENVHRCAEGLGLLPMATVDSPILGGSGNHEYLTYFSLKKEGPLQ